MIILLVLVFVFNHIIIILLVFIVVVLIVFESELLILKTSFQKNKGIGVPDTLDVKSPALFRGGRIK